MKTVIKNPTSYDMRSVIRFLPAKYHKSIEIDWKLREMYRDGIISEGKVKQLYMMFKNGRTNVHDKNRSVRPALVADDLIVKVDVKDPFHNYLFIIIQLSRLSSLSNDEALAGSTELRQ